MSLFEAFKKIFRENTQREKKAEKEIISFEQLYAKLEYKSREYTEKSSKLKAAIQNSITQFNIKMLQIIETLENIDLSQRKDYEKIKIISKENLNLYISHLKKLTAKLEKIDYPEIKAHLNSILIILSEFNKKSHFSFEKATLLIGKELEETRLIVKDFIKDINKIANDNLTLFEEITLVNKINDLFHKLKQNSAYNEELNINIKKVNADLNDMKNKYKDIQQEIANIRESDDYKKDLQEVEIEKKKVLDLEKQIQIIRQKIDLKLLARHFHNIEKKSQIIKDYATNFRSALENDESLELANLVKNAQDIDISSLQEIRDNLFKINNSFATKTNERIAFLEENLKKLRYNTISLEENIEHELKKKEKLVIKQESTKSEIKDLSRSLFSNIEI